MKVNVIVEAIRETESIEDQMVVAELVADQPNYADLMRGVEDRMCAKAAENMGADLLGALLGFDDDDDDE